MISTLEPVVLDLPKQETEEQLFENYLLFPRYFNPHLTIFCYDVLANSFLNSIREIVQLDPSFCEHLCRTSCTMCYLSGCINTPIGAKICGQG